MTQCWVCGQQVTPNTRRPSCSRCQGAVVTPDKPTKPRKENLSFREIERMMSRADTYERRGGKVRPRRYGQ